MFLLTVLQQNTPSKTVRCVRYQDPQQLRGADPSHKSPGLLLPIDLAALPVTLSSPASSFPQMARKHETGNKKRRK